MITVIADGDGRHRLEDAAGHPVGWVRGRAIGFRGMRTEADALAMTRIAWRPLQAVLRRHYFGPAAEEPAWDQIRLVHDGAYEWVSVARRPLARLIRPAADAPDGDFAIELVLPSYATEGVAASVALVVGAVLLQHLRGAVGAPPAQPVGHSAASDARAPA